jgi:hypothetical protein
MSRIGHFRTFVLSVGLVCLQQPCVADVLRSPIFRFEELAVFVCLRLLECGKRQHRTTHHKIRRLLIGLIGSVSIGGPLGLRGGSLWYLYPCTTYQMRSAAQLQVLFRGESPSRIDVLRSEYPYFVLVLNCARPR